MRKTGAFIMAGLMVLSLTACNITYKSEQPDASDEALEQDGDGVINFCYTDEKYEEFYKFCEAEYERLNPDINVKLEYRAESTEYLSDIINSSYEGESVVDVYMLSDNNLATAYLSGVAMKNSFDDFTETNYCNTALLACSYGDKLVAYPLSYDTTFMIYRSDIVTAEDVATFGNLILFSDSAESLTDEHPEIQAIFRSELNDVFINYGYVGAGFNIGGATGIDTAMMEIASAKAINLTAKYLSLVDYFALDKNIEYEDVISGFAEGKYISVIASTASLKDIQECEVTYAITEFPNYSNVNKTSPLALTRCVVVNPYASDTAIASDFARFVTYEAASYLYEKSGALSARKGIVYENSQLNNIYASYEKASSKNKLPYGEQVYPLIEIALHNIIAGSVPEDELASVEEYMKSQMN